MSDNSEIRSFRLENMIKEAVTLALFEQGQMPPPGGPANAGPVPPPAPPVPPEQNQPPVPQPQDPNQGDPAAPPLMTIDSMIERLNVIRGGKSFTDPEVYGQIVTYFKKITPDQNQVIDQFLQDISRIMVNVRTGNGDGADQTGASPPAAPPPGGAAQAPISPGGSAVAAAPAAVGGGAAGL